MPFSYNYSCLVLNDLLTFDWKTRTRTRTAVPLISKVLISWFWLWLKMYFNGQNLFCTFTLINDKHLTNLQEDGNSLTESTAPSIGHQSSYWSLNGVKDFLYFFLTLVTSDSWLKLVSGPQSKVKHHQHSHQLDVANTLKVNYMDGLTSLEVPG